jgi:hypothetical protein
MTLIISIFSIFRININKVNKTSRLNNNKLSNNVGTTTDFTANEKLKRKTLFVDDGTLRQRDKRTNETNKQLMRQSFGTQLAITIVLSSTITIFALNADSFLEKQRKLAEENWLKDKQKQQQQQVNTEADSNIVYEYEYYYEEEVETPPPVVARKKGFVVTPKPPRMIANPISLEKLYATAKSTNKCTMSADIGKEIINPVDTEKEEKIILNSRNYKQKQEDEKKNKELAEKQEKQKKISDINSTIPVGADCETLICGACKYTVAEFG